MNRLGKKTQERKAQNFFKDEPHTSLTAVPRNSFSFICSPYSMLWHSTALNRAKVRTLVRVSPERHVIRLSRNTTKFVMESEARDSSQGLTNLSNLGCDYLQ
jgi:hypothetical protein